MIWGLAKISPPFQALEFCRQPALSGGGWGIASQTQPVGEANPVLVVWHPVWQKGMSVYREMAEIPLGASPVSLGICGVQGGLKNDSAVWHVEG